MKVAIVFHSVCGNDYLIAKAFYDNLKQKAQVSLNRVRDDDWKKMPDTPVKAQSNLAEMNKLPISKPERMLESDLIIMGCPTYFGNVTAEMKTFMDETAKYWVKANLAGKKLVAFTSAGNPQGGGDLCLQAIHTYGKFMGMISLPVPTTTLPSENINPLGIIHYSNGKYGKTIPENIEAIIKNYSAYILSSLT
jgi:NAD(P)H dehydrogenase (quinone)